MKEGIKSVLVFLLVLVLLAGLVYFVALSIIEVDEWYDARHNESMQLNSSTYSAYYQNGIIRATWKDFTGVQDFTDTMVHEWAHGWYDQKFSRKEMKDWLNLTSTCGFESDYTWSRLQSKSMKVYEEWAQCVKNQWQGKTFCCQAKRDFITKTGVLNKI